MKDMRLQDVGEGAFAVQRISNRAKSKQAKQRARGIFLTVNACASHSEVASTEMGIWPSDY